MPRKDSGKSEERISFAEGKPRLEQLIQRGNELSSALPINEPEFQTCSTTALRSFERSGEETVIMLVRLPKNQTGTPAWAAT